MNRLRAILKPLRITWTAFWAVAAVLLCMLWGRSYWRVDVLHSPASTNAWEVWLFNGRLIADWGFSGGGNGELQWTAVTPADAPTDWSKPVLGFTFRPSYGVKYASVPLWFVATLSGSLATVVWLNWTNRFSLRKLLIAMTLVGVGLGAVVWSMR